MEPGDIAYQVIEPISGDPSKGAHGLEERGVYRIHQFEKQEMIVVCKPEESMGWYEKMWRFLQEGNQHSRRRNDGIVQGMGQVIFPVCALDADFQPPCLGIAHVCAGADLKIFLLPGAPSLDVAAFDLEADGSVRIPAALRPYMGGAGVITPKR